MESWWISLWVKELDDCSFCKSDYMRKPGTCDCDCKTDENLEGKIVPVKNASLVNQY